ncbi:MAG TPA: DUF2142 domain-containing protein [Acidimicrobiales bacterium]|nr:DUF2142 domain-containing protein [Acidimicrobiales bacterium]
MKAGPVVRADRVLALVLGRRRPRWWTTLAVLFAMTAAWSLATALMASPDEPAHTIKAAAVARGQFFGTPAPPTAGGPSPDVAVRVPDVFAAAVELPGCYAFHPDVDASCAPALHPVTAVVTVDTPAGRYEPLYYFVVGLPSLFLSSASGIRLMRLVGGLLCCVDFWLRPSSRHGAGTCRGSTTSTRHWCRNSAS